MTHQIILIMDLGSQYTQLVAKKVRECGVYCEIAKANTDIEKISAQKPAGIIVSTGAKGIDEATIKSVNSKVATLGVPVLTADQGDTSKIQDFLSKDCGAKGDWSMDDYAKTAIEEIKETVKDGKVLLALSGGVDSSVVAKLISKAIGKQLTCIFVDTGLMRKNEGDEVEHAFGNGDINFIRVNAQDRFLGRLKGVTNPEEKRKIVGEEFIRVFEDEAKKIGTVDFLAQGTIYADIFESGIGSELVKSHHNVGGLPEKVDFKALVEPVKMLFKNEVRQLGAILGLDQKLVERQPFPGPGLSVRVIGEVTKEKLDILRDADYIFREEIEKAGLNKEINQYFAILTPMQSVGIKDGKRTYDYTLALRAIITDDYMTAKFAKIPYEVLETSATRINKEVENVSRVVYDITSKPPVTIEWE